MIGVSEAGSAPATETGVVVLPPQRPPGRRTPRPPRLAGLLPGDAAAAAALRYALGELLLHVSGLACELPWIDHLELDATLAGDDIAVGRAQLARSARPRPVAALPPHGDLPLPFDCRILVADPGRTRLHGAADPPRDAAAFQNFVRGLSDQSKYYRFFGTMRELPPRQLARRTQIDYDREMVLVAVARKPDRRRGEILAEANYGVLAGEKDLRVRRRRGRPSGRPGHRQPHHGLLQDAARARGMKRMIGEVLSENEPMQAHGRPRFSVAPGDDPATLELSKPVTAGTTGAPRRPGQNCQVSS